MWASTLLEQADQVCHRPFACCGSLCRESSHSYHRQPAMLHLLHLHSYIYSVAMAGAGDRPFLCWWQHRGPSARWQPALQILTRATVCGALSVSIGSILQSAHGAASTLVDSPVGQRSRPQRKSSSRDRMGRRLQVLSIDDALQTIHSWNS